MGWLGVTATALLISSATPLLAQEKPTPPIRAVLLTRSTPVVAVPHLKPEVREVEDPQMAARRLETALLDRLKPLHARFRDDTSLSRVGAVVGLGALALGAVRREQPLLAVGGGALRIGLDRQLSTIRRSTGFAVEPRLERGGFSISMTRTFR